MRSRLAEEIRSEQARRAREMSAEEGLMRALAMGKRAIADYMQNFGVERADAVRLLRHASQAGRRYSACMDDDARAGSNRRGR